MSMDDAREFLREAWGDEDLQVELKIIGALDEETAFTRLVALAEENGFQFSKEEFRAANLEVQKSAGG
jgi:Nif11 domain